MKKTVFLMMILCVVVAGCSQQNPAKDSSSQSSLQASKPGPPVQIAWKVPSSTWSDLCTKIEIEIQDTNKMATMVSADTTVSLSSMGPSFYSDSTCSNSSLIASLVISQNTSSKIIYLKSSGVGIASIDAAASGLTPVSLNFNTVAPGADLVLGQADLVTSTVMNGGASATTDGNKVYVADQLNNRILIWNSKNPVLGSSADLVLGQPDFTSSISNNGGIAASSLGSVDSISSDGIHLFAVDAFNHRILIWNSIPTNIFQAADVVIGQPDMVSNQSNNGGLGAASLSSPKSVFSDGQKMVVADTGNNRILIWNSIPTANFQAADVVVGQGDMISQYCGFRSFQLNHPSSASIQQGRLTASDSSNHRILIWNTIPSSDGASADLVVGQANMTSRMAHSAHVSADGLTNPGGVRIDSQGRMFVLDSGSNRLLIWNQVPTSSGAAADIVIGQSDFISNLSGTTSSTFAQPSGLDLHANELWIGDQGNNRVLRMTIPF